MSLTRVFKFEADDLAANRQGELTEHQQQMLHDFLETTLHSSWQTALVILALAAVGIVIAFLAGNHELATFGVCGAFLMTITYSLGFMMTSASTQRLLTGEIRMAEGEAKLKTGRSRTGSLYRVRLGKKQFYVTKAQYEAFRQGQTYRLYYVDGIPDFILSVELL